MGSTTNLQWPNLRQPQRFCTQFRASSLWVNFRAERGRWYHDNGSAFWAQGRQKKYINSGGECCGGACLERSDRATRTAERENSAMATTSRHDSESLSGMSKVPEGSIAAILSHFTPADVCRLSMVNSVFRAAADSDLVWQKMLPPCYPHVVARTDDPPLCYASKRELYFRLCKSVPMNYGTQKYWLDPPTGGECYILSAKTLVISWGNNSRYWDWIRQEGSWFQEVAFLKQTCHFEMMGQFSQILKPGIYTVSFRIQVGKIKQKEKVFNSFGWRVPVKFSLSTLDGQEKKSRGYLEHDLYPSGPPKSSRVNPLMLVNDWMEFDVGEFEVEDNACPIGVDFSLSETKHLNWKGGLLVDGVMVRPSKIVKQDREKWTTKDYNQMIPFEGDGKSKTCLHPPIVSSWLRKPGEPQKKLCLRMLKTFSGMAGQSSVSTEKFPKAPSDKVVQEPSIFKKPQKKRCQRMLKTFSGMIGHSNVNKENFTNAPSDKVAQEEPSFSNKSEKIFFSHDKLE